MIHCNNMMCNLVQMEDPEYLFCFGTLKLQLHDRGMKIQQTIYNQVNDSLTFTPAAVPE